MGWKYYGISSRKLDEHHNTLKRYYEKCHAEHGQQKVEAMIKEAFEKKVIEWLVGYAEHNQNINESRAIYLNKYFVVLPLYLFALSLLYFLFYIR